MTFAARAFLAALLLGLAVSARAQSFLRAEEFAAMTLENSANEMSAEEFDRLRPGTFTYINPRSTDRACGLPLSYEEKIAQQALKSESARMRAQGVRRAAILLYGHEIVTANERGVIRALVTRPRVLLNLTKILSVRDEAWALERKHFPHPQFTGANDEADAFRHFVFASLLSLRLGGDVASQVLQAHEWYQRDVDTVMDRFNNTASLAVTEENRAAWAAMEPFLLERAMVAQVKAMIASGSLAVLKPRLGGTPKPGTAFYAFAHKLLAQPLD